ncbi:MAG: hypothetical protein HY727_12045 [Candidatus Rokubacteria bacterium]|nr:hypothetical protein [Candidatus Rokubacteria bacterium]
MYELKPEYAGRLLLCPACGRRLRAGPRAALPPGGAPGVDPAFDREVFLLRERVLTITAKYEVWSAEGTPILYVERPTYLIRTALAYGAAFVAAGIVVGLVARAAESGGDPGLLALLGLAGYGLAVATFIVVSMSLRPLRHVTVYRDDSRREVLLRVRQDQRFALLTRTYTVLTPGGEPLARLRKRYIHNIVRKRWYVESPAGERVAIAVEDSIILSLLRRILGSLFGALRTNFLFVRGDAEVFGEFNRKFTLLDRYVLDLSLDPERTFDRRVALALGVMLDTGERR